MPRTAKTGSGTITISEQGCPWQKCNTKHSELPEFKRGEIKKEEDKKKISGIIEPCNVGGWSYEEFGLRSGWTRMITVRRNKKKGSVTKKVHVSTRSSYDTQYHHVISWTVIKKYNLLKKNLELVGWDINNPDDNGICLPRFREDIVWHYLQTHRGSHPQADYYDEIQDDIEMAYDMTKDCCDDDAPDHFILLALIRFYASKFRDKILRWQLHVNKITTQWTWLMALLNPNSGLAKGRNGFYYTKPFVSAPEQLSFDSFSKARNNRPVTQRKYPGSKWIPEE